MFSAAELSFYFISGMISGFLFYLFGHVTAAPVKYLNRV